MQDDGALSVELRALSKWRLSPQMLEARIAEQQAVLEEAAALVKAGGRLAYITCSDSSALLASVPQRLRANP